MAEPTLKIVWAVVLDGTETIRWTDTDGAHSVTLAAGTYWCHNTAGFTDYPSLYDAIATAMTADAAAGYTFEVNTGTPTTAPEDVWTGWGVRINVTNPALSWTWVPAGTINALEVLGWRTTDSNTASASGAVDSPRAYRGAWRSPVPPDRYTSRPLRLVTPSTEITERADAYWFDQGPRRLRELLWTYVVGGHVYKNRNDYASWAAAALMIQGDDNNALEYAWEWGCTGGALILVWYEEAGDLDLGLDSNGLYEVCKLADAAQMQDFGEIARMVRAGGDRYDLSLTTARVGDAYTWEL